MKTKKLIVAILIFVAILMLTIFTNQVSAAGLGFVTTSKDRTENGITYRHQLYSNNTTETKNIWKLVTSNADGTPTNTVPDLYCLRAGLGFTSSNPNHTTVEYKQSYDLPRQYKEVVTYFSTLKSETNIFDSNKAANFKALIWILDNMLLEEADEVTLTTYLKKYAGYTDETLNKLEDKENVLSRSDVEAIQQLAIWYFTNSDEAAYNKETLPTLYMSVTGDPIYSTNGKYETFADIYDLIDIGAFGTERQRAAAELYKNLIQTAKKETTNKTYEPTREITLYLAGTNAANEQPIVRVEEAGEVDIALRKFISQVNDTKYDRATTVDTSKLNTVVDGKLQTTAIYNHTKDPVSVEIGNIVTYTMRLYNEGDTDTFITEVTDYLPKYLEYVAYGDDTQGVWWKLNGNVATTTEFCEVIGVGGNIPETEVGKKLGEVKIPAAEYDEPTNQYILSYVDIQISCKVRSSIPYDTNVTNIAQVTKMMRKNGSNLTEDRDSTPNQYLTLPEEDKLPDYTGGANGKNDPYYDGKNAIVTGEGENKKVYYPGQEDDDDFEKILVETPEIDLTLRKFISQVGDTKYDRAPIVDTSKLNTVVDGKLQTTAIYNHSKQPVQVEIGDVVTYTIRLYNEGPVDARVREVRDYIDNNLEYVAGGKDTNASWWNSVKGEKYTTLTSTENCIVVNVGGLTDKSNVGKKLADVTIPAYNKTKDKLSYVDIEVHCKVLPIERTKKLTNIAEITGHADEYGTPVDKDRDSKPNYLPNGLPENFPGYKDIETDKPYVPGQQDDDDFEKVVVKPKFDLSLRKFITKVGNTAINNRYPQVSYEDGKLKYTHTKEPLLVATGDIVTYTIRVYNENEAEGYANEITDDIPEGLEFLPQNETNTTYRWKMLDENEKQTDDVSKAKYLVTDYLSEKQEKDTGRDNLIKAFDRDGEITDTNPNWKEVQVAFKVTYVAKTKDDTERTIINTAQISADSDDDIDSVPKRDEVYNHDDEGKNEDDIDYDQVKVKYFDLSLLKWVDKTIITLNGKTTETSTGHTAETAKNEDPVKLEIKASDIKKINLKYSYTIRITNEGELEGYAKEIKDYVPEGLKFVKEDNPDWYETEDGQIATKALENTLLKPGESAEVKIILTWINKNDNFGEKVNLAEISKDFNESGTPDVDSTPNNKDPNEDDIDDAPVLVAVKTGSAQIYIGLILIILVTFAGGVGLIKKYVLE